MDKKSSWIAPVAIVVGLIVIVGAFAFSGPKAKKGAEAIPAELAQVLPPAEGVKIDTFRPVDSSDKLRGDASAPIKVVIYSDLECPACKYFHQEISKLNDTYVKTGKVAFAFRHFPLDALHSKARGEALAAECVAEIGGAEKFWSFVDKIFEITPSNNGLDQSLLAKTAKDLKIDAKDYDNCVKSGKYAESVDKTAKEAVALGAPGTPFVIVSGPNNLVIPVFGGIPADRLSKAFDLMLGETQTATTTAQ